MSITKRFAVVLARGGSKRIHRKNLQEFEGTPLVVLAAQVGVETNLQTFVSSDDLDILAQNYASEVVTFKRSPDTARDESSSEEAVLELADQFGWENDSEVILLPPTSPLRTSEHLTAFLDKWEKSFKPLGYEQAMSVVVTNQDIWMQVENSATRIRNILVNGNESRRSQERMPLYIESSAIYLTNLGTLREGKGFTDGKLALIPLPKIAGVDIDDAEDLAIARKLFDGNNG